MFSARTQRIRHLPHSAALLATLFWLFVGFFGSAEAQRSVQEGLSINQNTPKQLTVDFKIGSIDAKPYRDGFAILSSSATNSFRGEAGKPMLPEYCQIIQIPDSGSVTIFINSEESVIYPMKALGCDAQLAPVLPPAPKSEEMPELRTDSATYATDALYGGMSIRIETLGIMRGCRLARLTVSPIRYNPVRREVAVCHHISATINFSESYDSHNITRHNASPMLSGFVKQYSNDGKDYSNTLATNDSPLTYLIVAPQHFRQTLQPLVKWKRQEGYKVEEYYTETSDRNVIKTYLQRRYEQATPNRPAPLFILLVGDVSEIPLWPANEHIEGIDIHRTDLYYAEYTGDRLPEVLIGRLSTSDTTELSQIISKTIAYEHFDIDDDSYLGRSLLVAGREYSPPAPTVTNGQVNYLKRYIIEHEPQHDTFCYYNPSSETALDAIKQHLRQGVGFMDYTAHCTSQGWRYPTFRNYELDTLTIYGLPFISINNCCRANDYSGDCFGEHLLRKYPGGAVGVIGATNETLWNEDYYWSVGGSGETSLTPQYSPGYPGCFDRFFHTHQELVAEYATTLGQMVVAGNWAVTASGSPYDAFYWEIYSLLGDPSLMPYIGIPAVQQLHYDNIYSGDAEIVLHGTPFARVAATCHDSLVGVCLLDSTGNGLMHTQQPILDTLLITATAQHYRPLQTTAVPMSVNGPRLVASGIALHNVNGEEISQLTLCDTAVVSVTVHNAGMTTATEHSLSIRLVIDGGGLLCNQLIASLPANQDTVISFILFPKTNANALTLLFETRDSATYWQMARSLDILKARTIISDVELLKESVPIRTLLPSNTYELVLTITNTGNGKAKDLSVALAEADAVTEIGDLDAGDTAQCHFTITTPDSLDSPMRITVSLMHRTDTLTKNYAFAADSIIGIRTADEPATGILIYPNPADNNITISGFSATSRITIFDIYGRIVGDFSAHDGETIHYSTSHLNCGVYSILHTARKNGNETIRQTYKLLIAR